jgi:hypothetical protein
MATGKPVMAGTVWTSNVTGREAQIIDWEIAIDGRQYVYVMRDGESFIRRANAKVYGIVVRNK